MLNPQEQQYLDLMVDTRGRGQVKTDRTGTGTTSVFGRMMRFDLQQGIPLLTTKKIHLKSIIHELIWFLSGSTSVKYLQDNGITIWDEWVREDGTIGPGYGKQWRRWADTKMLPADSPAERDFVEKLIAAGYRMVAQFPSSFAYEGNPSAASTTVVLKKEYDQITDALNLIKHNPDSRRIIVSGWNVGDVPDQVLPPCHTLFQFYVSDLTWNERVQLAIKKNIAIDQSTVSNYTDVNAYFDSEGIPRKKLSCMLYARSQDTFLGTPFNIASYAILTHMFAQQADMAVGDFVWVGGDVHQYSNHTEQIELQLSREPRAMPELVIHRKPESLFDYKFEDFSVTGYDPHPAIKAPVAV